MDVQAPGAAQALSHGLVVRIESKLLNPLIELIAARDLVLEEHQVLGEYGPVLFGEDTGTEELTHPAEVTLGPVSSVPEHEAAASEEFQDEVAGLQDLALKGLAAADPVPVLVVRLGGDVDEREVAAAGHSAELDGIAFDVLALVTGVSGNQRRSGQITVNAPLGLLPLEDVTRTAGLVAGADRPDGRRAAGSIAATCEDC